MNDFTFNINLNFLFFHINTMMIAGTELALEAGELAEDVLAKNASK